MGELARLAPHAGSLAAAVMLVIYLRQRPVLLHTVALALYTFLTPWNKSVLAILLTVRRAPWRARA